MTPRSLTIGIVVSGLALAVLGCSLVGRAVDSATGGAASTLQAVQSELEGMLATVPAKMGDPPALPALPTGAPDGLPVVDSGGTITGNLSYPSEGIPPLRIVAFDLLSMDPAASVDTVAGQSTYSLSVPDGIYYVVAYTLDGRLAGGYTGAVECGLSVDCTDHALIPVPAAGGLAADGIDPGDWYAPEGTFPPAP
jgi:hypothetical protein